MRDPILESDRNRKTHECSERSDRAGTGPSGIVVDPTPQADLRTDPSDGKRIGDRPPSGLWEFLSLIIAGRIPRLLIQVNQCFRCIQALNMEPFHGKDAEHDEQGHDHELGDEKWRL